MNKFIFMKQIDKSLLHKFSLESFESRLISMKNKSYEKEKLMFNLAIYLYVLSHLLLQNINIGKKVKLSRNVENFNFPLLIMSVVYLSFKFLKHFQRFIIQGMPASMLMNILLFIYCLMGINILNCLIKIHSRHGSLTFFSCIIVMSNN